MSLDMLLMEHYYPYFVNFSVILYFEDASVASMTSYSINLRWSEMLCVTMVTTSTGAFIILMCLLKLLHQCGDLDGIYMTDRYSHTSVLYQYSFPINLITSSHAYMQSKSFLYVMELLLIYSWWDTNFWFY